MALTSDRNTKSKSIEQSISYPVKGATKIFDGSIVAVVAGYAVPAADAAGAKVVGIADWRADNTDGADGAIRVRVRRGVFLLKNDPGGGAIVAANIGSFVYVLDDQTVSMTAGTNSVAAGEALELDPDGGVWVQIPAHQGATGATGPTGPAGP